ncbi:MAG: type II toxin-antitoxin system RelE/ParE family toxin [Rhizobiales bacterium]|nr:type II toxin-antitoxin system RelE/ParE family toxin [Hyphomicrobiales bacterium]
MSYKLSKKAKLDLVNIYVKGVELFGVNQAEKYFSEFEDAFLLLSNNPKVSRERTEIDPPIRVYPMGVHVIIYKVKKDKGVYIMRIRHGREDW